MHLKITDIFYGQHNKHLYQSFVSHQAQNGVQNHLGTRRTNPHFKVVQFFMNPAENFSR